MTGNKQFFIQYYNQPIKLIVRHKMEFIRLPVFNNFTGGHSRYVHYMYVLAKRH